MLNMHTPDDWSRIDCSQCPERHMCDQVQYDCPLDDPPLFPQSAEAVTPALIILFIFAPPIMIIWETAKKILTAPIGRDTINTMEAPRRGEGRANHEKADC